MSTNPTILYVEDEERIRNELSKFLDYFSSELYIACDGVEGLELFKQHLPDVIISDIKMPRMNGIEMIKAIKKINPRQYIIFTTAHSESDYFIEAVEMRINGFVLKPIDFDILEEKLESIKEQINNKKEKELYEKYLIQQSRLAQKGEMISMIAHQWRQPLSSISATSMNMQLSLELEQFDTTTQSGRDEQKEFFKQEFQHIDNSLKFLSSVIDNFSNFYQPDNEPTMIKLETIISKSLNIMDNLLTTDEIEVIIECNSSKEISVYANELAQVIVNLLKNAQDSLRRNKIKNPKIKIVTEDNRIRVCDNGGGIDKDILDKIFDPYFSTKYEKNGTGLGLYMSKIIIEKHHNARLSVQNLKNGVCFSITFLK
ncbi:MAG: response regulator [Campylobacterota bacterium]|nr:response regulator [Campylobacterota bacterium]